MTDIKFECPGCGQHMECDRACGGDVIHCPRCCAELRIPFADVAQLEGSMKRAALIAPAGSSTMATSQAHSASAPADSVRAKEAVETVSVEVTCPVCHSELRIGERVKANFKPGSPPPPAELLRKKTQETPPTPGPAPAEAGTTGEHHLSLEEREKQIAAARQAHPISLNPPMKPRLEYVLSDKTPPLAKEGQNAEAGRSEAKENTVTE
jgi:hypothetical protein